jgi:hypothetical protein
MMKGRLFEEIDLADSGGDDDNEGEGRRFILEKKRERNIQRRQTLNETGGRLLLKVGGFFF